MSRFGDGTFKQDVFEYVEAMGAQYHLTDIDVARQVSMVLVELIDDVDYTLRMKDENGRSDRE